MEKFILVLTKEGDKDWLALITGPDEKWKFKRQFIKGYKDGSEFKYGASDEGYYEACLNGDRLYYQIKGGKLLEIEKDDIKF